MKQNRRDYRYMHVLDAGTYRVLSSIGNDPDGPMCGPFTLSSPTGAEASGVNIGDALSVTFQTAKGPIVARHKLIGITPHGEPITREVGDPIHLFALSNTPQPSGTMIARSAARPTQRVIRQSARK